MQWKILEKCINTICRKILALNFLKSWMTHFRSGLFCLHSCFSSSFWNKCFSFYFGKREAINQWNTPHPRLALPMTPLSICIFSLEWYLGSISRIDTWYPRCDNIYHSTLQPQKLWILCILHNGNIKFQTKCI